MRHKGMRAGAWLVLALLFIPVASLTKTVVLAIAQDGPLAPLMRLKVRTDENGYLRVSGGTPGAQDGPLTAMANLRGRTDENGYLRVALADIAGSLTLTNDGIGATSTSGLDLRNTTAAAAGAQQYSPRTCWEGQGWKTDATAASQSVVFCAETQPVEGAAAPTGNFILKASINGGAFSTVGTFTSGGEIRAVNSDGTRYAGMAHDGNGIVFNVTGSSMQYYFKNGGSTQWTIDNNGHLKAVGAYYVKTGVTTVGALPTCNAAAQGARLTVTDANATTFLSTAAAGGANIVPVMCNGTDWVIG